MSILYTLQLWSCHAPNSLLPLISYLIVIVRAAVAIYLVLDGSQLEEEYQLFLMSFEKPATL